MDLKLPLRSNAGHKGTFGTLAIAGGSISGRRVMLGSPVFAAKAAIRSGVGLINFIGAKELLTHLIGMVPQAVGITQTDNFPEKWQAIVVGPGLGTNKSNISLITTLLSLKLPTVIDADGLNTLSEYPDLFAGIHELCVLTPHPKEFARLAKAADVSSAEQLSEKLGCTVVLKGSNTQVTDGRQKWLEKRENSALATGGTGDVLAGLIGGLMAQYCPDKLPAYDCAKLGVYIHSKAGEAWRETHGPAGLIIDELLDLVPGIMKSMRSN